MTRGLSGVFRGKCYFENGKFFSNSSYIEPFWEFTSCEICFGATVDKMLHIWRKILTVMLCRS